MTRNLNMIESGIRENTEIMLKPLREDATEDLKMLNWLDNECFKEHFNYRPTPLERTIYFVRKDPFFRVQEWFFAILNAQHVDYVGVGIDEKYNAEKNDKCGWILDIGVRKPIQKNGDWHKTDAAQHEPNEVERHDHCNLGS